MAQHWASQGAPRLHVVDLDAARDGRPVNDAVIRRIVAAIDVPVQVAGGVRDHNSIHRWAEAGADRIIIGTLAVEKPAEIERAMTKHRDRISIAVDARAGKAAVKGWRETSDITVEAFVREMAEMGVRHFIYTDISRDGTLQHPDLSALPELVELVAGSVERDAEAPVPLVYSGGVTAVEDVEALLQHDIEGVIIGTALYDGRIDLRAAQRALAVGDDW
jgi:phosphoribosylformimino-5-aminoimidazole carboxamide ribotide isomerase